MSSSGAVTALLFKVYCYRGTEKQIWFEVEDMATGQGVAWSPSRATAVKKAMTSGWGRPGPELSWGTNSVATKNGWPASSTMRASPSASLPTMRRPAACRLC